MGTHPSAPHLALGAEGEARAARHLEALGYRLIARNVRAGGVEIDLVVRRGSTLVFVEVKTRRSERLGPPELAVDARKQARLVRGASAWLAEHGRGVGRVRFDVVTVLAGPGSSEAERWTIRHIEGAFDAGGPHC